jgi:hypothetical protein
MATDLFYITNNKRSDEFGHLIWWRDNATGYTDDLGEAGIYTMDQLKQLARRNPSFVDDNKIIPANIVRELAVVSVRNSKATTDKVMLAHNTLCAELRGAPRTALRLVK